MYHSHLLSWLFDFTFWFYSVHHKTNQNKIDLTTDGGGEASEEANAAAQLAMVDQVDVTKCPWLFHISSRSEVNEQERQSRKHTAFRPHHTLTQHFTKTSVRLI